MVALTKRRVKSKTASLQNEGDSIDSWISAGETFLGRYPNNNRATEIEPETINAVEQGFIAKDDIVVLSYSSGSLWLNIWNRNDPTQDSCRIVHDLPDSVRMMLRVCMLDLIPSRDITETSRVIHTLDEIATKHGRNLV